MASRPPKGHLRVYVSAGEFGIVERHMPWSTTLKEEHYRQSQQQISQDRWVFTKSKEANVVEVDKQGIQWRLFGVDSEYDMKSFKHFIQELHDPTEHFHRFILSDTGEKSIRKKLVSQRVWLRVTTHWIPQCGKWPFTLTWNQWGGGGRKSLGLGTMWPKLRFSILTDPEYKRWLNHFCISFFKS